ncbi:MAG: sugar phosphate nucleotidyltransferase [Candidatus Cloacimonadales bacterium]|jgi:mannose-1-phosphate guanylyltransferase|nr:mannose-1-phosphate guanylyltransferase [Candidatus Cloacimonadota bacterium]MDD2649884.1 sugar phosphate nucleotidyltransferase [Candidatus Cloacimonadota bacterium]MDD3501016.1 sugar phosphate nucleotidyltransferase [Candidatus Cloacimonadota bacterium]MDX9977099.1 sugar phosphate nucleotidyltransferase [Candidatus Cloacimonadales bacterium]
MIGLIMAGGAGTRFWPLSKKDIAKQYLKIFGEKSLIQLTYERLRLMLEPSDIYVVTTIDQRSQIHDNLPELKRENIIIEPCAMNTAACINYSANYLKTRYRLEETLLIVPADHLIDNLEEFVFKIEEGKKFAQNGYHVIFGIMPTYPATGYGYIQAGQPVSPVAFHVEHFKEKPNIETAKSFLENGSFFWNCGIFFWSLQTILKSFERYYKEGYDILKQISDLEYKPENYYKIKALYKKLPRIPVDIAVMEKTDKRVVLPMKLNWNDVGSYKSMHEVMDKDLNGNYAQQKYIAINSKDNLLLSKKLVCCIDIDNIVVVETDDVILILPKESSEKVKEVVEEVKNRNLKSLL